MRRVASIAVSKYTNTKPTFSQPLEICSFGLTEDGKRIPGVLKKLVVPKIPFDCDVGFETHVPKDPAKTSSLIPVLECLHENKVDIKGSIVTFRNNLNKILATPYNNDEWQVNVKRQNGTIFLDIVHLKEGATNPEQARSMYWGQSFEAACADSTGASNEYCSVVRTKLNRNSIIFGAEIDCYDPNYQDPSSSKKRRSSPPRASSSSSKSSDTSHAASSSHPSEPSLSSKPSSSPSASTTTTSTSATSSTTSTTPSEQLSGTKRSRDDVGADESPAKLKQPAYVEIKTNRILAHPNMERSFKRYKLMHCWIQSFLAGVPTIMFGFRDDSGVVRELQRFNTLDIPKHADKIWDPYVCLNFADEVMTMLWSKTQEGKKYSLLCKSPCRYVDLEEIP